MTIKLGTSRRHRWLKHASPFALTYTDFTVGTLPDWLTFSRASNAWYFNSSGTLTQASSNVARFDYNPASPVYSANNLEKWSQQFSNAYWDKSAGNQVTVTDNTTIAPDGTLTASTLTEVAGTGSPQIHPVTPALTSVTGTNYIMSIYVKNPASGGNRYAQLAFYTAAFGTNGYANFDLQAGTVGTVGAGVTAGISFIGNGWFRIWIAGAATAAGNCGVQILFVTSSSAARAQSFTVTAGSETSLNIWGAQIEQVTSATTPGTYLVTTSAQITPTTSYAPRGLLVEGARTNSIRNNTMVGAVAGTPGTMPTNWSTFTGVTGLTRTIVGTGTENGISYIDIQISGTPGSSGSYSIIFESATAMAALTGQFWNFSTFVKLAGGALTNVGTPGLSAQENTSGGSFVAGGTSVVSFTPTSSGLATQRYSGNRTLSGGGTVAAVQDYLTFGVTSGQAINVTLRIGLPQAEQLLSATQTASSPIPTTGSALTRSADIATITGVPATILASAQGTALVESVLYTATPPVTDSLIGAASGIPIGQRSDGKVVTNNGTTGLFTSAAPAWVTTTRAVAAWNSSGRSVEGTGQTVATDALAIGQFAPYYLGSTNGASNADGWYSRAAFWSSRLPDAVLTAKCVLGSPL